MQTKNLLSLLSLTALLQDQHKAYTDKPTKAMSARIRKTLMEIKKLATPAKAELLELDKGT